MFDMSVSGRRYLQDVLRSGELQHVGVASRWPFLRNLASYKNVDQEKANRLAVRQASYPNTFYLYPRRSPNEMLSIEALLPMSSFSLQDLKFKFRILFR
jgi:hypothetical protein